jgi:LruC domain-containing protein
MMKKLFLVYLLIVLSSFAFSQGTIVAWGPQSHVMYQNIPEGDDFIEIAAGYDFAVALREDGSVVTWGGDAYVIGVNPGGNDYIAIAAGEEHALALRDDGTIIAWGVNGYGQAEDPPHNDYVKISAGRYHNLALRSNGEVYAWGNNASNQCNVPAGTFSEIAAGNSYSLGISSSAGTSGMLIPWGIAYNGETTVPGGNDFIKVSAKNLHAIALRSNGVVEAWGNPTQNINVPAGTYQDISAGWQGNLAIRTDGSLAAWANLWVLITIPAWVQELDIVRISSGGTYSLGLTGALAENDADGDGVVDSLDEFPDDSERAYVVSYPLDSASGWGTLAFEDMWPRQGDYDFNDLVLHWRFDTVLNADLEIKDIEAEFSIRAVGASFNNSFAIEFPFLAENVETFSGTGAGEPYEMPIIEAGDNLIIKVISNTNDFVTVSGSTFWNTQLDQPNYAPVSLSFDLTLSEPYDVNSVPEWGLWNPFVIVNQVDGHEIHLPGLPPTIHADLNLFGEEDDTSNPETGRYYKTIDNLPWALNLPISWYYPIEKKQITQTYYGFAPWAESGGNLYQDWYELNPSQINEEFIYNP